MKNRTQVWLLAFLSVYICACIPSGKLWARQSPGAPAASEIDQLTGPIALYPDALVIDILAASKSFDTLKLFAGWLEQNASLKGSELQDAAQKFGFSEPLVALAPFPQVVKMMIEKPDWTKALGQAMTADKQAVSDSIQRMRGQAQALGNLKTTPQQVVVVTNVFVEKTVEQQVVVVTNTIVQIQPANPEVIYVPTYPQTVYVQQAPPPTYGTVAGAALVGFTVGVIVANNNHYHHHYDDYWDDRQDYARSNQEERQGNSQERQGERQGNQDQRQGERQGNQDQRQSSTGSQSRQSSGASTQSQASAGGQAQRKSAATPSSRGGGQSASRSTGMSSGGFSGYQSGGATRSQSSRGRSSMSSSRGGGGGGRGGRGR